ncbi:AT hook domain-containing protein [Apiospora arundinis]|uniref:AT hook domain-containing protein n=1 Tax=Apiospora arundinis TaxID=335852 RepID=A0ABR2HRF3_9PEZI
MAESREERMQQRMRGAGRHEVADESFGLILPVEEEESPEPSSPDQPTPEPAAPEPAAVPEPPALEPEPEPEPELPLQPAPEITPESVPRSAPNTSAKRRHLVSDTPRAQQRQQQQPVSDRTRSSARSRPSTQPSSRTRLDPYEIEPESPLQRAATSPPQITVEEPRDVSDATEVPAAVPRPTSRGSVSSRLSSGGYHVAEEVTESPADAPGSGHRRRVRISQGLATQSAQLQRAVLLEEEKGHGGEMTTSSPLARKTRTSAATTRTSTRSALAGSPDLGEDPTPTARSSRRSNSSIASGSAGSGGSRRSTRNAVPSDPIEPSSPIPQAESRRKAQAQVKAKAKNSKGTHEEVSKKVKEAPQLKPKSKPKPKPNPKPKGSEAVAADVEEAQEAEEVEVDEVARRIGRKRPRASPPREASPELDARETEPEPPAKKRRQRRSQESPAKQSQPKAPKTKTKAKEKTGAKAHRRRSDTEPIPIGVQRYTKLQRIDEDDSDADILTADIPFTNRGGVNVVDVLSQICEEVIEANLATLQEAAVKAENAPMKKEYRAKLRALEAFQEELRTRLLEHTIALDTMHSLKKRVRSIQKEKITLRNEILRVRAEREQVALKMDAVRLQHEVDSKDSLQQLGLSASMHDIELAVDHGRSAPELTPSEQKMAELANLELLVSQVAGQACAGGDGSGNLKQIHDFNAFLERAAAALEMR